MADIFDTLGQLANELDNKQLVKVANAVDEVNKALVLMKKAGHAGFQGWAVRNSRCWGKCYREKRATSPSKSAQEVWMTCWDEYNKALTGDTTSWDKYAEAADNELIKTASAKAKETFSTRFQKAVDAKLAHGSKSIGDVVVAQIELDNEYTQRRAVAHADHLLSIAEQIHKSDPELSEKLASASEELLKIAGIGGFVGSKMKGLWQGVKDKSGYSEYQATTNDQTIREIEKRITFVISSAYKIYGDAILRDARIRGLIQARVQNLVSAQMRKLPKGSPEVAHLQSLMTPKALGQRIKAFVASAGGGPSTKTKTAFTPTGNPITDGLLTAGRFDGTNLDTGALTNALVDINTKLHAALASTPFAALNVEIK